MLSHAIPPPCCEITPAPPFFGRFGAHDQELCRLGGVRTMEDFESKLEKYMARAAKCEEQAKEAADPTRADFYQVLGRYFRNLANDFKEIIEKRRSA